MKRHFPGANRFLEVGCGSGYVISALQRWRPELAITGSELLFAAFEHAQQRVPSAQFLQTDATSLPFDGEFDAAGAFDVIEHIEDDERALAELFRAVRPGGGIVVTVPQHRFLWSFADDYGHHKRRYSRGELAQKLDTAGFRVLTMTSFVSLLFPVLLLNRRRLKKGKAEDLWQETSLPWVVDRLFALVMALELLLIRAGLRFPLGGSLLVVAVRPR